MIKKSLISISFLLLGFNNLIANEAPALPVKTFTVKAEDNTTSKTYPTILKAFEQVNVMARVSGTLKEKYFNEGDFVKKGTLLYRIEPDIYQANLNAKKANFVKAKKDFERAKELIASKAISPQSFDDYTFQYDSAKAALDEAQINLNYTKVTAPIDGIVGLKNHDIGDLVGTSSSNSLLVTITNTNPIHAEFSIPKDDMNNYLSQIKDKKAKVTLLTSNKKYENGVIDFISPVIDINTDTLLVRAKFENANNELIVGNFTKVEISNLSLGDVFIVPENAVLKTAQANIVFVVDENNIAKPRPVITGDLVAKGMVIKGGLKPDEQVIISNLAKLRPDTKVQIVNDEK
ncbi:efflux RND transporter periplasmic adaptor subunit [Aliarcobacter lanthieri]|uniref:efflux RND transporter periplasmic adaptor subunit n=1 Tax=Aliarcobacter lanthieri TaxID=1355374 RepID=UPI00047DAEC7|nr:efflux RND transporter periplasmic adaptor subunit [Aliarcobacter lanthieri]QKF58913.1 RND family efflux system, membrane fusion protein [Aliarcobacter lanthieri]